MGEREDRITLDGEWPFLGGSRQRIDGRVFDDGVVYGWKNGVVLSHPSLLVLTTSCKTTVAVKTVDFLTETSPSIMKQRAEIPPYGKRVCG